MPWSSMPPGPREKPLPNAQFGRQCLRACRLAEAGVRYLQVNYTDSTDNPRWDQHSNLAKHTEHAHAVDQTNPPTRPEAWNRSPFRPPILIPVRERGSRCGALLIDSIPLHRTGGSVRRSGTVEVYHGLESYNSRAKVAERVGFEPTVGYKPTHDFESCALNRTQPPLRLANGNLRAAALPCKGRFPPSSRQSEVFAAILLSPSPAAPRVSCASIPLLAGPTSCRPPGPAVHPEPTETLAVGVQGQTGGPEDLR